jgi:predicted porin
MKNIMIKSAIATAVVAATTVTTIADVTLYGRINVLALCTDAGNSATDECDLQDRSSRFGIKASSEISDGLTAFGKYEFAVNGDTGSLSKVADPAGEQRLSYVGLKGGFGEVSYGTRWSPLYNHTMSPNDVNNGFGGTWSTATGFPTDYYNSDTINYKNKFGVARIGVQVQMLSDTAEDVDQVTVGGSFKAGSVNIGLAYQDSTNLETKAAIHASTKFGPVAVGATYTDVNRDAKADSSSINMRLGYNFGGGKALNLIYGQDDFDGGATPTETALEYAHTMGAGFKWYAGFSTFDADTAADKVNKYGVGMRYDF